MISEALSGVVNHYRAELGLLASAVEAGLLSVHQSRKAAIQTFLSYIDDERTEILIVDSTHEEEPLRIGKRGMFRWLDDGSRMN